MKGTIGCGLLFKRRVGFGLQVYTNADYVGSQVDRHSMTSYYTYLGGNLITWRSEKQNVAARSNAEVEFWASAQGLCEALYRSPICCLSFGFLFLLQFNSFVKTSRPFASCIIQCNMIAKHI